MKIYVASSWRNDYQPQVVKRLREIGHEVYDFKDADGFHWSEVDPEWKSWPENVVRYIDGLDHPCATKGFNRDMDALRDCDACIMVMPCGSSAFAEMGWASAKGKLVAIYAPQIREPELTAKMANIITNSMDEIELWLRVPIEL